MNCLDRERPSAADPLTNPTLQMRNPSTNISATRFLYSPFRHCSYRSPQKSYTALWLLLKPKKYKILFCWHQGQLWQLEGHSSFLDRRL